MCAKTRRVKIEIAAENIEKIKSLLGDDPLILDLEVKECKDTFSTLSQPEVINWEFIEDGEMIQNPVKSEEEEVLHEDRAISSTADIVRIIEANWMVLRLHPGIMFNTELFNYNVQLTLTRLSEEEEMSNGTLSSDRTIRAVSKMLLDVFYNNPTGSELYTAASDAIIRISLHQKEIKEADSLNKVMDILYRKDKLC
jgi:hypothetical protein